MDRSTFVSSHFRVEEKTLIDFFNRIRVKHRRTSTHFILEDCPNCPPHKGKQDNKWKLYVSHTKDGAHFCQRCGQKGSWFDLKGMLTGKPGSKTTQSNSDLTGNSSGGGGSGGGGGGGGGRNGGSRHNQKGGGGGGSVVADLPLPDQHVAGNYPHELHTNLRYESILHYLTKERGLTVETLKKYCVGANDYTFRDGTGLWTKVRQMLLLFVVCCLLLLFVVVVVVVVCCCCCCLLLFVVVVVFHSLWTFWFFD